METLRAGFIAFAFTVKIIRRGTTPTEDDYLPFFAKLAKFQIEIEYKIPEFDKMGRLHYHGIIYLKKGFYRKKICVPGMHIKLEEIYDKKGWEKYIHKDCGFHNMPTSPQDSPLKLDLSKSLFRNT